MDEYGAPSNEPATPWQRPVFVIGDRVRKKDGGPVMRVQHIYANAIICTWLNIDGKSWISGNFGAPELERVPDDVSYDGTCPECSHAIDDHDHVQLPPTPQELRNDITTGWVYVGCGNGDCKCRRPPPWGPIDVAAREERRRKRKAA